MTLALVWAMTAVAFSRHATEPAATFYRVPARVLLVAALAVLNAHSSELAPARIALVPDIGSSLAEVYASGNLWIARGNEVWRFGSRGTGEVVTLPAPATAILPRGGTVDLVVIERVLRLSGAGLTSVADLGRRSRDVVAVRNGFVVLRDEGLVWFDGVEPRPLSFLVRQEDSLPRALTRAGSHTSDF